MIHPYFWGFRLRSQEQSAQHKLNITH